MKPQNIISHPGSAPAPTAPLDYAYAPARVPTVTENHGKSENFEGVRESQGKQRGSGKGQGILKYCSLDQLFMHYFQNFCQLLGAKPPDPHWGFAPRSPPGLCPCKHCRLVYIAIFYNGTKFSITFVYLVLFYWCHE